MTGALEGDPADPELIWLRSIRNQRPSIVWPAGFTVPFEPDTVLLTSAVSPPGAPVTLWS